MFQINEIARSKTQNQIHDYVCVGFSHKDVGKKLSIGWNQCKNSEMFMALQKKDKMPSFSKPNDHGLLIQTRVAPKFSMFTLSPPESRRE